MADSMHIQLRCAGRVPALSTPVRQFKLAVSHLYRPESTLMAPIRELRAMPEAALHLLLWCLATWLAGVSVLLHMTFGILTLAVRQLTAFLGLRIKGGGCQQVAPVPARDAGAPATDAAHATVLSCVPCEPDAPQPAGMASDTEQPGRPSDSDTVLPDSRPAAKVARSASGSAHTSADAASDLGTCRTGSLTAATAAPGSAQRAMSQAPARRSTAAAAAVAELQQSMAQLHVAPAAGTTAQPAQPQHGATLPPPAPPPLVAKAAQPVKPLQPWAQPAAQLAAQQEAAVAGKSALLRETEPAAPAQDRAATLQQDGFRTPERRKPRAATAKVVEAPAPAAQLTPVQQRAELQHKAQARVRAAQAALRLAEVTEPLAAEPLPAGPKGGQVAAQVSGPAPSDLARNGHPDKAAAQERHAASSPATMRQIRVASPQGDAAAAASRLGGGTDATAGCGPASAQAACGADPALPWLEAAAAPGTATWASTAAASSGARPKAHSVPSIDGAAAASRTRQQLRTAETPAEVTGSPAAAAAAAACQLSMSEGSPVSPSTAAAGVSHGGGGMHGAEAAAAARGPQRRHSSAATSQLLAGEHWEDAVLPDGRSIRGNSRGEAWFNEDAVIRIDQSEFRRLHARLQPTTASPLHDPFWQPASPAAQPAAPINEPSWWGREKPRGSRLIASTGASAEEWPSAVRRLASESL